MVARDGIEPPIHLRPSDYDGTSARIFSTLLCSMYQSLTETSHQIVTTFAKPIIEMHVVCKTYTGGARGFWLLKICRYEGIAINGHVKREGIVVVCYWQPVSSSQTALSIMRPLFWDLVSIVRLHRDRLKRDTFYGILIHSCQYHLINLIKL